MDPSIPRLRILMMVHGLPPASIGGTELAALRLACALADRHEVILAHPMAEHHGVVLAHPQRKAVSGGMFPPGTEHRCVDRGVLRIARRMPTPASLEETWLLPEAESWFQALVREFEPDVCHFHHLTGLSIRLPTLARTLGLPSILTLHDYWMLCARGQRMNLELELCPAPSPRGCATCLSDQALLDRPVARVARSLVGRLRVPAQWLERGKQARDRLAAPDPYDQARVGSRLLEARRALEAADRVTAPSRHLLEAFRALVPSLKGLVQVEHGFEPRAAKPPLPPPLPPSGPLKIGFLGAFIPTKAPHALLDAIAGLPSGLVALSLAGPSPPFHRQPDYLPRLREAARARGIRIEPPCPPEEVAAWLRRQHVLALPSIWPENAPLVIGEAFCEGVPVMASDIGGIPEQVLEGVNGLLLPPGDVGAWSQAMRDLAGNPALLERLRQGAWSTPLPDLEGHVRRWEGLYAEVVDERGVGRRSARAEGP